MQRSLSGDFHVQLAEQRPIYRTGLVCLDVALGVIDMAYTLQALVTVAGEIQSQTLQSLRVISVGSNVKLIPLGRKAMRFYKIPFLPFTDDGETETPQQLHKLCEVLSPGRTLAYIEAEIFGGTGTQACVVFKDGKQIGQPIVSATAINQALQILGVKKGDAYDEFEAAGLGAHRDTDAWLEHR